MRSPALSEFADWFHQTRDMLLWAALGVAGLIVGLWWVGTDHSSPIPAAEQAVREALQDAEPPLGKSRMHHWAGYRQWLVCGVIEGDTPRPFAALVQEKKHSSPLSMIGNGDRVRVLAVPGITAPHTKRTEMLDACAALG
ncbi:hypothetical protein [Brevundimonas sp.]|uniref:hypothetical protein n=1 Tax=Brevundimonas sp. TaxID=1871086 RepID=UPI003F717099